MRLLVRCTLCSICLFAFFSIKIVSAQDYKFSLFDQNRTYFNPAFTGMEKGLIRTNFIYRRQWLNFPGEFSTKHFNIDWKNYSSSGFGVFLLSDIEGESLLTTNSIGGQYSWRGTLDKYSGAFFQLGLAASYNEKKIDISKLTFSDQLDEIYGKIYGSSFVADQNKRNYIDFSVGGLVSFRTEGVFGNAFTHIVGIAFHHITQPNESFQGQKEKMPMKFTIHAQSEYVTQVFSINRRDKLSFMPWVLYEKRGESVLNDQATNSMNIGIDITSDPAVIGVSYKSHLNGHSDTDYTALVFKAGTKIYGSNKNIIYRMFYAYELAINNYTRYTRNSHEIGLSADIYFKRRRKCINHF